MRPFIRHPSHPFHDLYLKSSSSYGGVIWIRCNVCGNAGPPHHHQWLYRCDPCNFDVHAECSVAVATSVVTTTQSPLTPGSQFLPPACYPPSRPPISTASAVVMNQTQQQSLPGYHQWPQSQAGYYQQPAGTGVPLNQALPPQVTSGGYPNSATPTPRMGMTMGTLLMGGVASGIGQGIAGQIFHDHAFNPQDLPDSLGSSDS